MPVQKKKTKIEYLNEIKKLKKGKCPNANSGMKRDTLQAIARELRKTNKTKKTPKTQQVAIKMRTPEPDRTLTIIHKRTRPGMPSRPAPFIKTELKSTSKPKLSLARFSMPTRSPPQKPSTIYQQKALERKLTTINEKAILPAMGYLAQNQWFYDEKKDLLLKTWLPKIIKKEASPSLTVAQKKNAENFIKGLYKVINPKDLPKTTKEKYDKIITYFINKYD
jgi:hypothetical protein